MKIFKKTFSLILLLSLLFSFTLPTFAETHGDGGVFIKYSRVIDDIKNDPSFDINQYPADNSDMSVKFISIAEGSYRELYVYVYQPADASKDLKATHINMSTHHYEDEEQNFQQYSLMWIDSYGTIDKYLVEDFKVSEDLYRYYNIATIYRAFDSSIDDHNAGEDDVTGYKGFSVGKCIGAYYYNDTLKYDAKDVSIVEVEIKSTGIVRYPDGYVLKMSACDSHFVAFKVNNFDVKDIFDATITYTLCDYSYSVGPGIDDTPHMKNIQTITQDITYSEKGSNSSGGIFGHEYIWSRIQTVEEFRSMLEEQKNEKIVFNDGGLHNAQFVFNFLETDYHASTGVGTSSFFSKRVTNVAILRLHFATDTGVYNLGAVSDIVSDDGIPDFDVSVGDNVENNFEDFSNEIEKMLNEFFSIILFMVIVVALIVSVIFFKPIWILMFRGVTEMWELVWAAVTLPFELIASAFKNKRR